MLVCLKAPLHYVTMGCVRRQRKASAVDLNGGRTSHTCTDGRFGDLATKDEDSVLEIGPNSHNVPAAETHVYKPTNQNTYIYIKWCRIDWLAFVEKWKKSLWDSGKEVWPKLVYCFAAFSNHKNAAAHLHIHNAIVAQSKGAWRQLRRLVTSCNPLHTGALPNDFENTRVGRRRAALQSCVLWLGTLSCKSWSLVWTGHIFRTTPSNQTFKNSITLMTSLHKIYLWDTWL